jgi:hypothetical protein
MKARKPDNRKTLAPVKRLQMPALIAVASGVTIYEGHHRITAMRPAVTWP